MSSSNTAILQEWGRLRAMTNYAHEEATQAIAKIWEFAKKHPWLSTAAVFVIMAAILGPGVLGFGNLGPIEGTLASWWQSTFGGFVPAGSIFSFFQRAGMLWWI
ncbi:hypothetical protein JOM56_012737 [Amanita muscaria]